MIRRASLMLVLLAALALVPAGAPAQEKNPPAPSSGTGGLERAAGEVGRELREARRERDEVKRETRETLEELKARVAKLKADLTREENAEKTARELLAKTGERKQELTAELADRQGDLEEMAGLVRGQARELLALCELSPVTAQFPERLAVLQGYLNKSRFPGLADIERLVDLNFQEMEENGRIVRWQGPFVDREGHEDQGEILRIGGFTTLFRKDGKVGYLTLGPSSGRLLAVGGDPSWMVGSSIQDYYEDKSPAVYMDIGGGAALAQLARKETLWETLLSGGPLVWPILLVGLAGLILTLERLFFLHRVRANTDLVMGKVAGMVARKDMEGARREAERLRGRPTGNVLLAGLDLQNQPQEVVENGLSEAILREMPRLERFLTALKVLAAVAPLLGLLGTVTGMINTFAVITAFGTGDPRLMAGGISEALVTTQLGLAVAIPIMMAAALLGRRAQNITSDMEEKALALSAALIQAGE